MHREIKRLAQSQDYKSIIDLILQEDNEGDYSLAWISYQLQDFEPKIKFEILQNIIEVWEEKFGNIFNTKKINEKYRKKNDIQAKSNLKTTGKIDSGACSVQHKGCRANPIGLITEVILLKENNKTVNVCNHCLSTNVKDEVWIINDTGYVERDI